MSASASTMKGEPAQFTPYGWPEVAPKYLAPTRFLDYDHPAVAAFVDDALRDAGDTPKARAMALFLAVRDGIRYNPYSAALNEQSFSASVVLHRGEAFCIPKAVLLAACARCAGIPAAVGLADVKNHFSSDKLRASMGGQEVFLDHGFAAMHVNGQWLKVVPAFNRELCERMGVPPTAFDGEHDAIIQTRRGGGAVLPMEYLRTHGVWSDLPFARIRDDYLGFNPSTLWSGHSLTDAGFGTTSEN